MYCLILLLLLVCLLVFVFSCCISWLFLYNTLFKVLVSCWLVMNLLDLIFRKVEHIFRNVEHYMACI